MSPVIANVTFLELAMRHLSFFLALLITTNYAYAGGSLVRVEVVSFTEMKNDAVLVFKQDIPNGKSEKISVRIKFGCSQKLACFTQKRAFSKKQHIEAMDVLRKLAVPKATIDLGLFAGGYAIINGGERRSYGAYYDGTNVSIYGNSHP